MNTATAVLIRRLTCFTNLKKLRATKAPGGTQFCRYVKTALVAADALQ
jgi:hypothetical protein